MNTFLSTEGDGPNMMPEWQSPQSIAHLISQAKPGDIVRFVPQGEKFDYLMENLGVDQMHGCVDDATGEGNFVYWSTLIIANGNAFREDEQRAYEPKDIRLMVLEKAEEYIPKHTKGKFSYGDQVQVKAKEGLYVVTLDSFFDDIMSGKTTDGIRVTGGKKFFKHYTG
jgi:hypothetical protein